MKGFWKSYLFNLTETKMDEVFWYIYVKRRHSKQSFKSPQTPKWHQGYFYEIDFRETKWLKCGTYHHQNDDYYFYKLGRSIDLFRFILIGGFNSEKSE